MTPPQPQPQPRPRPREASSPPAALPPLPTLPELPEDTAQAPPAAVPAAGDSSELRIARLEGQVAALEAALERRSNELQVLQRLLCPRDLVQWARVAAGLPPLPQIAYAPGYWHETRELSVADVPETLEALWCSLHPKRPPGPAGGPAEPARTSR